MLDSTVIQLIQDNRSKSIQQKQLTSELLDCAYRERWFKIWVPKEYGGLGMTLVEGLRFLEEMAYWDGGLSWTVTLCSGANMFVGFVEKNHAKDIFTDPKVCFGGSGQVCGKAVKVEGGYRLTGVWPYATGAPHLTHFTANATLQDTSEPIHIQGQSDVEALKSFFIPKEHVLIHYDWDTFGLEATASHSFSVDNVFVPDENAFDILPDRTTHDPLLFQYPFKPFAELTLFVNYLGIFRRFCGLVQTYFHKKSADSAWNDEHGRSFFSLLDHAESFAAACQSDIYTLANVSWANLEEGNTLLNNPVYDKIAHNCRSYVNTMKDHFMALFPKCGIRAAQLDNEMNMVFRNFFTATQHSLLNVRK